MIRNIIKYISTVRVRLLKKYYIYKCRNTVASYAGIPTINRKSQFTNNVYLGVNDHFNGMFIAGKGKVEIGDNFHSGQRCQIFTVIHNYIRSALHYDHISRSIVTKAIPALSIAVGYPAIVFSNRNE